MQSQLDIPELKSALNAYRIRRRFDPRRYIQAKSALLNAYFTQNGISGCVLGLSGGVDSAVTLALLVHASRQPGSQIRRILPLLLPMHGEGATHQDTALARGAEVAEAFGVSCVTVDLSTTLMAARDASKAGTGIEGSAWASGQLVSYLRTPMLYYQTALLTEQGFRAVLCGTTNRDEGSYIGFFGKASDGMVDLQPISDIHKSEVYQVAALLGVPLSVRIAVPTGDTYDGACDEEMIGAPYDALELYTWYLCSSLEEHKLWSSSLSPDAFDEFVSLTKKFERLHRINSHKYIGDSPAVHLDIYERAVPGGWRTQEAEHFPNPKLREAALAARVGPVELNKRIQLSLQDAPLPATLPKQLADFGDSAALLSEVLNPEVCDMLIHDMSDWKWVTADFHGRVIASDNETSASGSHPEVGSFRATAYDEEVAQLMWDRIAPLVPACRTMGELTPTDWNDYPVWRPVGINPMLRFIRYEKGGGLVPHYDAGFDYKDGSRHTLMSVVVTLTPPSKEPGGDTRFLIDRQRFLPLDERDYSDHLGMASSCDVLIEAQANQGDVLIFDHRVLHDGSIWNGTGSRILLRTDIIFERCAPHAIHISKHISPQLPPAQWVRDPIFRKAYEVLGDEAAIEGAGYFDDGLENLPGSDPKWWSAPFDKILKALTKPEAQDPSRELFVLVTTGAFCPIHVGHLEMMERARSALEERGNVVLGGYFAPDHDAYVSAKCGKAALSAPLRLGLCERAVCNSDWLMVDRWAALHAPTAVNFTTIIERLQKYLAYHIRTHRPIQLAFVFGSDNAYFSKAFAGRGSCVCVLRPGYEDSLERIEDDPIVNQNPRMVFSRLPTSPWASSQVRRGDIQALPEEVKQEWIRLSAPNFVNDSQSRDVMSFYVRNEGNWAVQPWTNVSGIDTEHINRAYYLFLEGLREALKEAVSGSQKQESGPPVRIITLDLDKQKTEFQALDQSKSIISLDTCLPGTTNIAVSRCFQPLSRADPVYVPRPGAEPLDIQLGRLPKGSYVLFDDDTFSGKTLEYVSGLIEDEGKSTVGEHITLCDAVGPLGDEHSTYPPRLNLVDCRDFLAGAREAGLVLELPDGSVGRAPYILPYVRPHHRASILVTEEVSFSRRVWELNKEFFSSLGVRLRILDMSDAFRQLCEVQGFDDTIEMQELCTWHIEHLT